jgi:hypothetical protein
MMFSHRSGSEVRNTPGAGSLQALNLRLADLACLPVPRAAEEAGWVSLSLELSRLSPDSVGPKSVVTDVLQATNELCDRIAGERAELVGTLRGPAVAVRANGGAPRTAMGAIGAGS